MKSPRKDVKKSQWSSKNKEAPNLLYKIIPGNSRWARFKRNLVSIFLVSPSNPRTHEYFRSKEAIQREMNRQLTKHFYMIHPFSIFRIYWEIFTMIMAIFGMFSFAYMLSYIGTMASLAAMISMFAPITALMLDIVFNFGTGLCNRDTKEVILSFKKVFMAYVQGLFVFDLLGCLPLGNIFNTIMSDVVLSDKAGVPWGPTWTFRMLTVLRVLRYYKNLVKVVDISFMKERLIKLMFLMIWVVHFLACVQLHMVDWFDKSTGSPIKSDSWLGQLNIRKLDDFERYLRSLQRVCALMTTVCVEPTFIHDSEPEQLFCYCFVVLGQFLTFLLIANAMHLIRMSRVASANYETSSTHLQQYLTEKKIPTQLKKRVQDYFEFKYHKSYFNENVIMETISETLRKEILVFKCQELLENAQFFSTLPEELKESIVIRMKNIICQPDDIIIKCNDSDNCMYFIKSGTVAVYSSLGKEVCHLEDGNHFGEISLMLSGVRRVSTVIALEDCELYRLEQDDFFDAMGPYPDILKSMKKIAEKRMQSSRRVEAENKK